MIKKYLEFVNENKNGIESLIISNSDLHLIHISQIDTPDGYITNLYHKNLYNNEFNNKFDNNDRYTYNKLFDENKYNDAIKKTIDEYLKIHYEKLLNKLNIGIKSISCDKAIIKYSKTASNSSYIYCPISYTLIVNDYIYDILISKLYEYVIIKKDENINDWMSAGGKQYSIELLKKFIHDKYETTIGRLIYYFIHDKVVEINKIYNFLEFFKSKYKLFDFMLDNNDEQINKGLELKNKYKNL